MNPISRYFKIFWLKLELKNQIKIFHHNKKLEKKYRDEGDEHSANFLNEINTLRDAYLLQLRIKNLKEGKNDIDFMKQRDIYLDEEYEKKNQFKCQTCGIILGITDMFEHIKEENPKLFKKYWDWDRFKSYWIPVENVNPKYIVKVKN